MNNYIFGITDKQFLEIYWKYWDKYREEMKNNKTYQFKKSQWLYACKKRDLAFLIFLLPFYLQLKLILSIRE